MRNTKHIITTGRSSAVSQQCQSIPKEAFDSMFKKISKEYRNAEVVHVACGEIHVSYTEKIKPLAGPEMIWINE